MNDIMILVILSPLSMIVSRSIYVAARGSISAFLWVMFRFNMCHIFFIPLLMDIQVTSMSWLLKMVLRVISLAELGLFGWEILWAG